MATDLYSDNSGSPTTTTPRISFSYDLSLSDTNPVEQFLRSCSSSSVDFNFCVQENSDLHHASMADELFSEGKILPSPMKTKTMKQTNVTYTRSPTPLHPGNENFRSLQREDDESKQQNSKSFWGFKRSSSCGSGYGRGLCPIALLSRSHSMGSSTGWKQSSSSSKEGFDRKYNRNLQKPPLRKNGYGSHANVAAGNRIRVNPVLNLGFGSFFTGCSKNKNRK